MIMSRYAVLASFRNVRLKNYEAFGGHTLSYSAKVDTGLLLGQIECAVQNLVAITFM